MVVWAVQNGGFDDTTWYWGALVLLATFTAVLAGVHRGRPPLSRAGRIALGCFAAYVAWSYLSMLWAQYPGLALDGSNRALLYLLMFALLLIIPWTRETALASLLLFAVGVGVIAVVLLVRLASNDSISSLFVQGRLAAPTGYINSTAALFTIETLVCIGLSVRRELAGPLRGLLLAFAAASLQLAVIVQSRGWLFTLPIVALVAIIVMPDRLRVTAAAVIPIVAALIPVRRLLHVYQIGSTATLDQAAVHAARPALAVTIGAFVVGTLVAWGDRLYRGRGLTPGRRRAVGIALVIVALAGVSAAGLVVSKGHPGQFISRQWRGFSHEQTSASSSHFTDVGSGRYDFWRVALDAFVSHPIGGLGQDNFADYYLTHRHTGEEPSWTHSLELRLLAHTGIVGFLLFAGFMVAAIAAAMTARRRGDAGLRLLAGTLLMPLVVWLIHGSLDWFWEVPALAGPALGFLGAAGGVSWLVAPAAAPDGARDGVPEVAGAPTDAPIAGAPAAPAARPSPILVGAGIVALVCATVVLAFPFLSAREVSLGSRAGDPTQALNDLHLAAQLNPLSSDPGRVAGAIALRNGLNAVALERFRQSIDQEPGGWFSWLGAGLAASALGDREQARHDFTVADSIDARQPAVAEALRRVGTRSPLTSEEAFKLLVVVQ
jgi:O-antigen ligase/polysaccharide polymerase Wzy-like membrane protein